MHVVVWGDDLPSACAKGVGIHVRVCVSRELDQSDTRMEICANG